MRGAEGAAARVRFLVPPPLRKGDLVGVAAPGFAVERDKAEAGVRVLERLGLRVRLGASVFARDGYFAGADHSRSRDLVELIEDPEIRAIHFARGGWGTSRFLASVPWGRLARRPKLLIGYSDLTSLFAPALDWAGLSCVYGPLVTELGERGKFDLASLRRAYFRPREAFTLRFAAKDVVVPGRAEGRAAGGCLTLLAHLAGTPYAPRLRRRVLLIEEIGEPPYRIDRMLTQMRLAGMLEGVTGVLVGGLEGCEPRPPSSPSASALEVIASFFEPPRVPVVAGLRFGHVDRKLSLPLGFRIRLDTARRSLVFTP